MPEGDSLHLAARRLQVLVGQRIEAESPHPRAQAERVAERIDGRRLESVQAHGKNLVLRGEQAEGVLWNGPVLELHTRALGRLGPDILERPPRIDAMLERMRRADPSRWLGETLLDQTVVAGIGNMWLAESLWEAEVSPWRRLPAVREEERRRALEAAAKLMRASVDGGRVSRHRVYRLAGRPCARCRTPIRSWGQGDDNRIVYWCPGCQAGDDPRRS